MKKTIFFAAVFLVIVSATIFVVLNKKSVTGLELYFGDDFLCEVSSRSIVDSAEAAVDEILSDSGVGADYKERIMYKYNVSAKHSFADSDRCAELLLDRITSQYVRCYEVRFEGKPVLMCETYELAEEAVRTIKSKYETYDDEGNLLTEVSSVFSIESVVCQSDYVFSRNELLNYLGKGDLQPENGVIYAYFDPCPPNGNFISLDELYENVSVETISYRELREAIPFSVDYVDDPKLFIGDTNTVSDGVNGVSVKRYKIKTDMSGSESAELISVDVECEPINKVEAIGSKNYPTTDPTGEFIVPIKKWYVLFTRFKQNGTHRGVDLACPTGTPVYAADGGEVTLAREYGTYGLLIKLKHGDTFITYYGHLSKILVEEGDKVYKGQKIGEVGSTGHSEGPHLHLELYIDKKLVDPELYFPPF